MWIEQVAASDDVICGRASLFLYNISPSLFNSTVVGYSRLSLAPILPFSPLCVESARVLRVFWSRGGACGRGPPHGTLVVVLCGVSERERERTFYI